MDSVLHRFGWLFTASLCGCTLVGTDGLQSGSATASATSASTASASISSVGTGGAGQGGGQGGDVGTGGEDHVPFCDRPKQVGALLCADFDRETASIGSPPWGQDPPTSEVGAMDDHSDHATSGSRGLHVTYAPREGEGGSGGGLEQIDPYDYVLRRSFTGETPSRVTLDFELQFGGDVFKQTVADLQWHINATTRCRLMLGFVQNDPIVSNGGSLQNQLNELGEPDGIPTFEFDTQLPDTFHHVTLTADFAEGAAAVAVDDYTIEFDSSGTDERLIRDECIGALQSGSLEIWVGGRFVEARDHMPFDAYFDDVVLHAFP